MITEDQKKAFKEVLGSHYSKKVQSVLVEKGITDNSGKTHSNKMIIQVMNGETGHYLIEDAIITAVENQVKANQKLKRKKEKLLKSA